MKAVSVLTNVGNSLQNHPIALMLGLVVMWSLIVYAVSGDVKKKTAKKVEPVLPNPEGAKRLKKARALQSKKLFKNNKKGSKKRK